MKKILILYALLGCGVAFSQNNDYTPNPKEEKIFPFGFGILAGRVGNNVRLVNTTSPVFLRANDAVDNSPFTWTIYITYRIKKKTSLEFFWYPTYGASNFIDYTVPNPNLSLGYFIWRYLTVASKYRLFSLKNKVNLSAFAGLGWAKSNFYFGPITSFTQASFLDTDGKIITSSLIHEDKKVRPSFFTTEAGLDLDFFIAKRIGLNLYFKQNIGLGRPIWEQNLTLTNQKEGEAPKIYKTGLEMYINNFYWGTKLFYNFSL